MQVRNFQILLLAIILFGSLVSSNVNPAFGLSCEGFPLREHFAKSDLVFAGKVLSTWKWFPTSYSSLVEFEIKEIFKGATNDQKITVDVWEGPYDMGFTENRDYIVLARYDENKYSTGFCIPWFYAFPSVIEEVRKFQNVNNATYYDSVRSFYISLSEDEQKLQKQFIKEDQKIKNDSTELGWLIIKVIFWLIIGGSVIKEIIQLKQRRKRKLPFFMPEKELVSLKRQTIYAFIPILNFYALYKVKKLTMYVMMMVGLGASMLSLYVLFFFSFDEVLIFGIPIYLSIYLTFIWSKKWNEKLERIIENKGF